MARLFSTFRNGVVLAAFFCLLALIAAKLDQKADQIVRGPFHAVDGDTLSVAGDRLRLQGIDAPELDQVCEAHSGQGWSCGVEARRLLARLVSTKMECLGRERDRYDRLLVRCHDGTADIGAAMARQGLAVAAGDYTAEEAMARRSGQGLWAGRFEHPRDWRAHRGMMDDPDMLEALARWIKQVLDWTRIRTY